MNRYFEICVFIEDLKEEMWPLIIKGLNRFDMKCSISKHTNQFHPNYVPFSFNYLGNKSLLFRDEMSSGFYFFVEKFNFRKERKTLNNSSSQIIKQLKSSNYKLVFQWVPENIFSLRFAFLASAIVTDKFKGVCLYTPKNLWQIHNGVIKTAWEEVKNFERFALPTLLQNLKPCEYIAGMPWKEADLELEICLN